MTENTVTLVFTAMLESILDRKSLRSSILALGMLTPLPLDVIREADLI